MHTCSRRRFLRVSLALAGVGLLVGCGRAPAPPASSPRPTRIGFLSPSSADLAAPNIEAFRQGLRELGYVEGQDVALEVRVADGRDELLPGLAAELVGLSVDVILTGGREAIHAAKRATRTVPIVFAAVGDPVADGLVESLARPGGNATGLTIRAGEEYAKRLQLLKEAVPGLSRVAVLGNERTVREFGETEAAARALALQVLPLELASPDDLDAVMAAAVAGRPDGLLVITDAVFQPIAPRIVALAAHHRLPAMYGTSTYARAGGLFTYGVRIPENYRRAAVYVDKILKGTPPADLPVEQPTTFDFVINLKAADAIGLAIPRSVLAQATEIIQ